MFNWLFQLFGKTDYKKLKKEMENEIKQRRHEVLRQHFIYSKVVKVFKNGNWENHLITGTSKQINEEEERLQLETKQNLFMYKEEILQKEEKEKNKKESINKIREKIKQRKHSK